MISSNILIYNEDFLSQRIALLKYQLSEELNFQEIGDLVKESRVINKRTPIFQFGKNLYSSFEIKIPSKFEKSIVQINDVIINLETEIESKEILRHLIGEIIATQLRNHESKKWRADLGYGLVYHVTNLIASTEFEPLHLWYGFRYSPIIFDDGKVGIIVDPRFKISRGY